MTKLASWILAVALTHSVSAAAQTGSPARTQENDGDDEASSNEQAATARVAAQGLTNRNALTRQRAAEELAYLAAADHRKLVEGYRLQEKKAPVRLALDWALYRMGKRDALFAVVQALDSSRSDQAATYLSQIEGPQPLYVFLEATKGKTRIRLLEVLARIGDAETLTQIKPYASSSDRKLAERAQFASNAITRRMAQASPATPTRPRQVGREEQAP